jgi:large subunit ribosomal protein L27
LLTYEVFFDIFKIYFKIRLEIGKFFVMAHTKAKGTSKLGRDSRAKRLGVKVFSGQKVNPGQIIARQRGSKYFVGQNVKRAGDDSLYSLKQGVVIFSRKNVKKFTGKSHDKVVVSVH